MKCELCHQKDAETAIQLEKDGEEQELYVCRECANRERVRRQKKLLSINNEKCNGKLFKKLQNAFLSREQVIDSYFLI